MERAQLDPQLIAQHQRGALDSSGVLIYTIDRDFKIVSVSAAWQAFAQTLGGEHLASTEVGADLLDGLTEPRRSETATFTQAIFAGSLSRYERDLELTNGSGRHVLRLLVTPVLDDQSEVIGAAFHMEEITARRLLEAETWVQHQQLQTLVDELARLQHVAAQLTADGDLDHGLVTIATALAEALPASQLALLVADEAGQLQPQPIQIGRSLDLGAVDEIIQPLIAALHISSGQPRSLGHPDVADISPALAHRSVWLEPIRGHDGTLLGAIVTAWLAPKYLSPTETQLLAAYAAHTGMVIENAKLYIAQVKARHEAEQQHAFAGARSAQLMATIAAMCDGVVLVDQTGRIELIDEVAQSLFGPDSLVVGDTTAHIQARLQLDPPFTTLGLDQALQGLRVEGESRFSGTTGELMLELCATPVRNTEDAILGAVVVIRDVSYERAVEHLKDDFLSIAAHELKTPITTLKGYAQLALKRLPQSEEFEPTRRSLETIDAHADRITRLVGELLDVSRIQAGRLDLNIGRFDLIEVIRDTAREINTIHPRCSLHLHGAPTAVVDADLERIEQVLRNVIGNAIKFSPHQCSIDIAVQVDATVEVVISDQGVGVEVAKLPHIFEPWYQAHYGTEHDRGGLGLGLHISKEIVERHGGTMSGHSEAGKGLAITFTLPRPSPLKRRPR